MPRSRAVAYTVVQCAVSPPCAESSCARPGPMRRCGERIADRDRDQRVGTAGAVSIERAQHGDAEGRWRPCSGSSPAKLPFIGRGPSPSASTHLGQAAITWSRKNNGRDPSSSRCPRQALRGIDFSCAQRWSAGTAGDEILVVQRPRGEPCRSAGSAMTAGVQLVVAQLFEQHAVKFPRSPAASAAPPGAAPARGSAAGSGPTV